MSSNTSGVDDTHGLDLLFSGNNAEFNSLLKATESQASDVDRTEELWMKVVTTYFPSVDSYRIRTSTKGHNGSVYKSIHVGLLERRKGVDERCILTIHFYNADTNDPVIDCCNQINRRGYMKGYIACIKALGHEFEMFRCARGNPCTEEKLKILSDDVPEDAKQDLSMGYTFTEQDDLITLDKVLRSLREQTVQNGGPHPASAPTYDVNIPVVKGNNAGSRSGRGGGNAGRGGMSSG